MPLYVPAQRRSCKMLAIEQIALRFSECQSTMDLAEAATPELAAKKIWIGPNENEAPQGEVITEQDFAQQHFRMLLQMAPNNGYSSQRGKQRGSRNHSGTIIADLRRYIRESESQNDVYCFFLDRVAALVEPELFEAAEVTGNPYIERIDWIEGPWEDDQPRQVAQGSFYWAKVHIVWGRASGN